MIQSTSKEKYQELMSENKLSADQKMVVKALYSLIEKGYTGATDSEIARELGEFDPVNSKRYRPRRTELVEKGYLMELDKRACEVTGSTCIAWGFNDGTGSDQPSFLSDSEMNKIFKLLARANGFQKNKVLDFLNA